MTEKPKLSLFSKTDKRILAEKLCKLYQKEAASYLHFARNPHYLGAASNISRYVKRFVKIEKAVCVILESLGHEFSPSDFSASSTPIEPLGAGTRFLRSFNLKKRA